MFQSSQLITKKPKSLVIPSNFESWPIDGKVHECSKQHHHWVEQQKRQKESLQNKTQKIMQIYDSPITKSKPQERSIRIYRDHKSTKSLTSEVSLFGRVFNMVRGFDYGNVQILTIGNQSNRPI